MELKLTTASGEPGAEAVILSDVAFGAEFKEHLIHQVVTAYMAKARAGTRAHKNRAAVNGGGAKPWRQKGTGRARAGTIRSPIWRGGGKTFASGPQDYSQKVNRKMYRSAMRSILSELVRQDRLVAVDSFSIAEPKTKVLNEKLAAMGLQNALIVVENEDQTLELAARNLPHATVTVARSVDPVSLIRYEKVVMTSAALKHIEEMFS